MKNIQILLLTVLVAGTAILLARRRSPLVDRVFVPAFVLAGTVMVAFPQTADRVATALGVGRGVDAVICFMLAFLSYVCLQLYSKLHCYEARLVELARSIAIQNAKMPEPPDESLPKIDLIVDGLRLYGSELGSVHAQDPAAEPLRAYANVG